MAKKKSGLGLGVALGAAAGAIAGVLFAPKTGKKTREDIKNAARTIEKKVKSGEIKRDIKKLTSKISGDAKDLYKKAKSDVDARVKEFKKGTGTIKRDNYEKIVADVVSTFKKDAKYTQAALIKLKKQLQSDAKRVVSVAKKATKKK